ncbi:exopolygalacturonase-like [Nymphaea colorata]|nr:exopolygalacturonase-like [Nymphaea colorata]
MDLRFVFWLSSFALSSFSAISLAGSSSGTYSVDDYSAKGDGKSDDTKAFNDAWAAACADSGSPTLMIPGNKYVVGPLLFKGPCQNTGPLTVKVQGTVLASTNLNLFTGQEWVLFYKVNQLRLTGTGTFDGQGTTAWPQNQCPFKKQCKVLPVSLKFAFLKDTVVSGITSLNPKMFHIALLNNVGIKFQNVHIKAPGDSPNTDGIHIETSTGVKILQSDIATGDDCISIGHGNTDVYVEGVNCGPGHGISVGSLGRYSYEKDVTGVIVKGCTISGTMNGVRIKSWQASPSSISATNMTFDNIILKDVGNPIIIDQNYCPFKSACAQQAPSRVKISGITFSNIRGTSTTPVGVTMQCSKAYPCQNIKVQEINLSYNGPGGPITSSCANVKASYSGKQVPDPCN